ncbi:DEAD/DEAH box helicase [Bdellovibrionales bacterium]|nr:DEAD/DEAH box helicase [Bdellovibrionales bacterium]
MSIPRSLSIQEFFKLSQDEFLEFVVGLRQVVENIEKVAIGRGGVATLRSEEGHGLVCCLDGYMGYISSKFIIEPSGAVLAQENGGSNFSLYYFYRLLNGSQGLTAEEEFCQEELDIKSVLSSLFSSEAPSLSLREVGLISSLGEQEGVTARVEMRGRGFFDRKHSVRFVDREEAFHSSGGVGRDILNRFYFEFSDNRIFSLSDIIYSPYAALLPDELVPGSGMVTKELLGGYYGWDDHCVRGDWGGGESKVCLEILSFFIARSRLLLEAGRVQFCILDGFGKKRDKLSVCKIEMANRDLQWALQISGADIFIRGKISSSQADFFENESHSDFDSVSGSLIFNGLTAEVDRIKSVDRACRDLRFGKSDIYYEKGSVALKFQRETSLRLIEEQLKKNKIKYISEVEEVSLRGGDKLISEFSSGDNRRAEISVIYEGQGVNRRLVGTTDWLVALFMGLDSGIAGYLDKNATELAIRDYSKRSAELRLYKHSGLFLLLLLECLKYLRAGEKKKSFNKFIQDILQRVEEFTLGLISKRERWAPENLEGIVSKKFISQLKKVVKRICDKEALVESFYFKGKCWHVHYESSLLNLVELLSEIPLGEYSGKAFTRASFNCFEIYFKDFLDRRFYGRDDEEEEEGLELGGSQFIIIAPKGLNFRSFAEKSDCRIDGANIETILDRDLVTQFHLEENSGSEKWFDLNPKVFFKGEEVSRDTANRFLKDPVVFYDGRYYFIPENQVPALKWLDYFWERLHSEKESVRIGEISKGEKQDIGSMKSEILNLLALRNAGVPVVGGPRWKSICDEFDRLKDDTPMEQRRERCQLEKSLVNFNAELKPFQLDGVLWLKQIYNLGLGAVLSDEMGLGKTVQSLAFLEELRVRGEMGANLIIVPTSLVYNWSSEISRFCPHMEVNVFESKRVDELGALFAKGGDRLVICTYGLLVENRLFFEQQKWNVVFFDEAQSIKNIKAKRREAAGALKANSKVCITGTPMENHYGEFFSMIDLVVPGALGRYSDFMKIYKFRGESSVTADDVEFLKKKIRPLVLRRSKQQVLSELPDKAESVILLEFDKRQEKIYRDIAISWNSKIRSLVEVHGEAKSQLEMLTALMRLRQACSCPQAIPNVIYDQPTPKEELLIQNVTELIENRESVIVFTNFVTSLDLLKKRFTSEGLPFLSLCGRDSLKKREQTLKQFSEDEGAYILAMTLKTGGVGLNLTKASYVIHFEPWWNPAAENQGTDRVHRIGQKRSVQVYRYIMKDSVEEKIQDLKKLKSNAFEMLFSECESSSKTELKENIKLSQSTLTQKDFEILLR